MQNGISLAGVAVVAARGELDLATAPALRDRLTSIIDGGCPQVVLDLAGLDFCDSQGLSAIEAAADKAQAAGGRLTLAGTPPNVARLFEITRRLAPKGNRS